ncbi:hypothetical protein BDA96_01G153700 [Sorghum bicolor]|uniref:Uncharacterized protein n=1 Tax=Sorghum bicolor TaxID=4558 RepID=A0A921RY91_SORBI|nr:hypothetical protein BDA96_01G153700 [Sorghum bicolor]
MNRSVGPLAAVASCWRHLLPVATNPLVSRGGGAPSTHASGGGGAPGHGMEPMLATSPAAVAPGSGMIGGEPPPRSPLGGGSGSCGRWL